VNKKNKALIGAVLGAFVLAAPAASSAQQIKERAWYVGGSAGGTSFDKTCDQVLVGCDKTDSGGKFFIGRQFSRHLAIEGGYAKLGTAKASGTIAGLPATFDRDANAWDVSAVMFVPLGDRLSLFGKLGFSRSETKFKGTVAGGPVDVSEKRNAYTFGAGAQYSIGRSLAVRAEFQRYTKTGGPSLTPYVGSAAEDTVDLASLGILWKF
jgi:OmpA-OmpF porin, OOP family